MSLFFNRRSANSTDKALKELNEKIQKIEKALEELTQSEKIEHQISIESLNMKDPVLENLTFQLDQLKLEEVSGALNLGNNFGITVHQKPKHKKKKPKDDSCESDEETTSPINDRETSGFKKTSDGYQFHFDQN